MQEDEDDLAIVDAPEDVVEWQASDDDNDENDVVAECPEEESLVSDITKSDGVIAGESD